jgi:plastocyanin
MNPYEEVVMMRICLAFALLAAGLVQARDIEVKQKDHAFSVRAISARVGDRLVFHNEDASFHNAFSVSKGQWFNLGAYPKDATRTLSLLHEGTLEIECAMHPGEKLVVTVAAQKTRVARSDP